METKGWANRFIEKLKLTYKSLSQQKALQINKVLALFRDRAAIFTRMSFLQTDRTSLCKNKGFQPSILLAACRNTEASESFRCKMKF